MHYMYNFHRNYPGKLYGVFEELARECVKNTCLGMRSIVKYVSQFPYLQRSERADNKWNQKHR